MLNVPESFNEGVSISETVLSPKAGPSGRAV